MFCHSTIIIPVLALVLIQDAGTNVKVCKTYGQKNKRNAEIIYTSLYLFFTEIEHYSLSSDQFLLIKYRYMQTTPAMAV